MLLISSLLYSRIVDQTQSQFPAITLCADIDAAFYGHLLKDHGIEGRLQYMAYSVSGNPTNTLPKNKDFEPFEEGEGVFSTFCYKCVIS